MKKMHQEIHCCYVVDREVSKVWKVKEWGDLEDENTKRKKKS